MGHRELPYEPQHPRKNMRSQALKGRHNIAQGVSPVYGINQHPSSPSTRQWRVEGEEKKRLI